MERKPRMTRVRAIVAFDSQFVSLMLLARMRWVRRLGPILGWL